MIHLAGATQRSFTFPGRPPEACAFYADFERLVPFLPHIYPVKRYAPDKFRLLYRTTELGLYVVRLYCDIQVSVDADRKRLTVAPLAGHTPVKPRASLSSLVAQACFTSESRFDEVGRSGRQTHVHYALSLTAVMPKVGGLRLVPDTVVEHIAAEIAAGRIHEIADGFIERSQAEYVAQKLTRQR